MIYLIGSLRNPRIPEVAAALRVDGHDVFDDWYAAGPQADDIWQVYEEARGRSYVEALSAEHANWVFRMDYVNLLRANVGVMVLPAGKSAYIETGFMIGQGKHIHVLMEEEPARWDMMLKFATTVNATYSALAAQLTTWRGL